MPRIPEKPKQETGRESEFGKAERVEDLRQREYEEAEMGTVKPYSEDVEKEKTEAREEVEKAFAGPTERVEKTLSAREYFRQELPKRLDEKERGLETFISEKEAEKEETGKKLSKGERDRLTSDYYLKEMNCERRVKGSLFGKPLRIYDKEKGAFLMNEKGKPLKFGNFGEMSKYLREEKLINDELDTLRQEWKGGKPPEKEPENLGQYLEQNLGKAFQEKKGEIDEMVEEEYLLKQSQGEKFTPEQRYAFEQKKYLEALGYELQKTQTMFGFGEKARIITDPEKGTPLLNEKGKPVEVPKGFFWYGPYRINAILKEQLKEKVKDGLEEQWGKEPGAAKEEKEEETGGKKRYEFAPDKTKTLTEDESVFYNHFKGMTFNKEQAMGYLEKAFKGAGKAERMFQSFLEKGSLVEQGGAPGSEKKPEGPTREELRNELLKQVGKERMEKMDELSDKLRKGEISEKEYWEKHDAIIDEVKEEKKKKGPEKVKEIYEKEKGEAE